MSSRLAAQPAGALFSRQDRIEWKVQYVLVWTPDSAGGVQSTPGQIPAPPGRQLGPVQIDPGVPNHLPGSPIGQCQVNIRLAQKNHNCVR
jgi:hypothetical protein